MAACSVVALSVVMYGCGGGGHSQADLDAAAAAAAAAAAEQARQEAEAAAAAAAAAAAEQARQEAVAEAERKAAEAAAAAEKMARAATQKAAIVDAVAAAQSSVAMVTLGASDEDIAAAEAAIQAITDAIAAAVDVDDTSMYSAQALLLNGNLATATSLVHQDRATRKMARADAQKGAIASAIEEAETAVAAIDDATTPEAIAAAATTAGEKVQAAKDAIAAAVDVDDTSMYTATVDGLETSVGTSASMARSAYQSGKVMAALSAATTAVGAVELGATDMEIEDAEQAIKAAKEAIDAAKDVDDTSMYTAQVNALESTLTKTVALVEQDRNTKRIARAAMQKRDIADAIKAAQDAVGLVVEGASDQVIADAETAVKAAEKAIADAVDVDDTSMYTATVVDLANDLQMQTEAVLIARSVQQSNDKQIAAARMKAETAMTAAMTASTNAGTAADAAEAARTNIATMQTSEQSGMRAMAAREHAKMAMDESMKAKTASEEADAATTVADAVAGRIKAKTAQADAEKYAKMAGEDRDSVVEAVKTELFIDGTEKTVGGSTVDAKAGYHRVTLGDSTTITGLLKDKESGLDENPMHLQFGESDPAAGQAFAVRTPPASDTPYVQAVAARDITLGKTLDSSDDKARLMLITSYASTKKVPVFKYSEANPGVELVFADATPRLSTTEGKLLTSLGTGADAGIGGTDADDRDVLADLKSLGPHYRAGTLTESAGGLVFGDVVAATDNEPLNVYRYRVTAQDGTHTDTYLVLDDNTRTEAGTTVYIYRAVDIMAADARRTSATETTLTEGRVTADLPVPKDYDHIHFGVWAALGEAAANGGQSIAEMGIGFVQNHDDSGETGNMPLQGDATYNGNWAAAIRRADSDGDGIIELLEGAAELMADFEDNEIAVYLNGLAKLEGDITGSTFGGTKVSFADTAMATGSQASNVGSLDTSTPGDFSGTFSGAFYGAKAAEAGGIFDYTSDEEGEFRGAFGARKKTD